MGLLFPVYAGFFAEFRSPAGKAVFTLGCVGAGLIVGLSSFLIGKVTVLRVIRDVARRLDELCEAEGDLTRDIGIASSDGIGALTGGFDRFLAKLRSMVLRLAEIAEGAQRVGFELAANSTETSAASVAESINLQSDSLTRLSALVERTVEEIGAISALTRTQAKAIAASHAGAGGRGFARWWASSAPEWPCPSRRSRPSAPSWAASTATPPTSRPWRTASRSLSERPSPCSSPTTSSSRRPSS